MDYEAVANTYVYYPLVEEKEYTRFAFNKIFSNYFNGSYQRLVSFLVRIWSGVLNIIKPFRHYPRCKIDGITHVFIDRDQQAFSFFNWLFYNKDVHSTDVIVGHELVHIRQKHRFEVLFIELIQAFNWFNPIFRYLRSDIRLNHEYIVDEQISLKVISKYDYLSC